MLKIQEIREIIKLIDQSSIEKFSYELDGAKLELKKGSSKHSTSELVAAQPAQQLVTDTPKQQVVEVSLLPEETPTAPLVGTQTEDSTLLKVISPMVGTFYSASSPDVPAYVQNGDKVKAESIVCIVEAMKLFNEIEAEVSGEIVEILVKDGQLVEYGQPLFLVKAN